ncbi:MAG: aldo/keto reductase [Lysobacterales bacterium 69-70]|nr:MAG: aldo/keto reductase [Xanthomonadaceae bacterium SCN 69-320]ODV22152.1 MAG: aldo/keto reductase [Xanthomonadaceae bacterium SCN 69-25]OJY98413.1 MAG: aldo/keto reductase [Xanthomonadales bacterium 69-70]
MASSAMSEAASHRLVGGVRMPLILYGTAWKQDATAHWVETALRAGFAGIDTAGQPRHYDEAAAGAGIAASARARDTLYLQTKFTPIAGQDPARLPYDPDAPLATQIAQSFASSQRNLSSERIDALLLHSPLREPSAQRVAWRAFETLADAGQVGLLGISNCYEPARLAQLWRDARIKPAIVQNRFYAQTGYDREIRAFCRANGLVYQSFWTLSANPALLNSATVLGLAAAYDCSPAQILFRWLIQNDVVPLTGTTSTTHLRQSLDVLAFELETQDCTAIAALLA